jgi:hypothetical protein
MFCKVTGCRYPSSHVSTGHKCGRCSQYGHGQYECKKPESKVEGLSDTIPEYMRCEMPGCRYKQYHTTHGHSCNICRKWGVECSCPYKTVKCPVCRDVNKYTYTNPLRIFGLSQKCSVCMENDIELMLPGCRHACLCLICLEKLTVDERKEMKGSDEMERFFATARRRLGDRNNVYVVEYAGQGCAWYIKRVGGSVTGFFLHGDNHGQYGPETNDLPRLEIFLTGCTEIH